jgi:hypothetical protein
MSDVEDLLRAELRARVDAAEAAGPDSALRLADLDARIRRVRLRRRWTGAALGGVAVAVAVALSSSPAPGHDGPATRGPRLPLTDTAVTPAGWAPVAYGNVQISVPARWRVASRLVCGRAWHGFVVLGTTATSLVARNRRCKQAANMVAIQILPKGQGHTRRRTGQINGIPLLGVRPLVRGSATFLVPTMHVLITARGPLANQVLRTLTRSPLSVVLAAGRRFPPPHSWRWHHFGGIRFATPGAWRVQRSRLWFSCWDVVYPALTVELVRGTRRVLMSCAPPLDRAGFLRPSHGVAVGFGRYVGLYDATTEMGCRRLHGLRACFYWPSPGRPLELAVFVPGRSRPTLVEVGLKGSGAEARTIVESIRSA